MKMLQFKEPHCESSFDSMSIKHSLKTIYSVKRAFTAMARSFC